MQYNEVGSTMSSVYSAGSGSHMQLPLLPPDQYIGPGRARLEGVGVGVEAAVIRGLIFSPRHVRGKERGTGPGEGSEIDIL